MRRRSALLGILPFVALKLFMGTRFVAAQEVKNFQAALVDLDTSEAGRSVIANSKKKLTGHVIAEDALFDVVRRTAKIAGM